MDYTAHPTAVIDEGCTIGAGTRIWHFSHIMPGCVIGTGCNIGQNVVVSPDVRLGDNVKVQNNVSIYTGVECEDDVFLGPSMVFTNVYNPRSAVTRKDEYRDTVVRRGATLGANCTIVCGVEIGQQSVANGPHKGPVGRMATLQSLVEGEKVTQVVEGGRRFALVVRLPESSRSLQGLGQILLETPGGPIPLSKIATIEDGDGPNQVSRDDGKRRIVLSANAQGRALSEIVEDIRKVVGDSKLPEGYFITLGGQFQAQEEASRLVGLLSIVSLVLMFVVLFSRYKSVVLSAMIMANIPLALVGAVFGLWISGQPLSVAALVGFITLAGISVRNGILKVSHYINLMRMEGENFDHKMVLRGSLERLAPVLMTALVTAFALAPLLFEAERPGTEILHPVAVVIFSGLISSTLLDTFLTPVMFWLFGRNDVERLMADRDAGAL